MAEWPNKVTESVNTYFPKAEKLLSVQSVNEISNNGERCFDKLQSILYERLKSFPSEDVAITQKCIDHAHLAIINKENK